MFFSIDMYDSRNRGFVGVGVCSGLFLSGRSCYVVVFLDVVVFCFFKCFRGFFFIIIL